MSWTEIMVASESIKAFEAAFFHREQRGVNNSLYVTRFLDSAEAIIRVFESSSEPGQDWVSPCLWLFFKLEDGNFSIRFSPEEAKKIADAMGIAAARLGEPEPQEEVPI